MNENAESCFREAERSLDGILAREREAIEALGFSIADQSARTYHYKNETLVWCYWFELRRRRERQDLEKFSLAVSLDEFAPSVVKLRTCTELFQIGQSSRWNKTEESEIALQQLVHDGMLSLITREMTLGMALVAQVK